MPYTVTNAPKFASDPRLGKLVPLIWSEFRRIALDLGNVQDTVKRAIENPTSSITLAGANTFNVVNGLAGGAIGVNGIAATNSSGTPTCTINFQTGAVTLSGTITASAGAIGGFSIGTDYIRDAADSFGLASTVTGGDDVRFWAGATYANRATAPARIYESGAINTSNLTVTGGTINATTTTSSGGYSTVIRGESSAASAEGVMGIVSGADSRGVIGLSQYTGSHTSGGAWGAGVLGSTYGTNSAGVYGVGNHSTGLTYGVYGTTGSSSSSSAGVYAEHTGSGNALSVSGKSKFTGQITSTLANGTAPFAVTSSTNVANLYSTWNSYSMWVSSPSFTQYLQMDDTQAGTKPGGATNLQYIKATIFFNSTSATVYIPAYY